MGRAALDEDGLPELAPALAAMESPCREESSTSASTPLSSSSFSASNGATSRSFSAACWSISICLPSWAYFACFCRRTSWISFMQPPVGNLRGRAGRVNGNPLGQITGVMVAVEVGSELGSRKSPAILAGLRFRESERTRLSFCGAVFRQGRPARCPAK